MHPQCRLSTTYNQCCSEKHIMQTVCLNLGHCSTEKICTSLVQKIRDAHREELITSLFSSFQATTKTYWTDLYWVFPKLCAGAKTLPILTVLAAISSTKDCIHKQWKIGFEWSTAYIDYWFVSGLLICLFKQLPVQQKHLCKGVER